MGINLDQLKNCVATYGCVARIVIGEAKGSVPRDIGTSMMVWARGQIGTIGGGALEFQAVNAARRALRTSKSWISPHPLGLDVHLLRKPREIQFLTLQTHQHWYLDLVIGS